MDVHICAHLGRHVGGISIADTSLDRQDGLTWIWAANSLCSGIGIVRGLIENQREYPVGIVPLFVVVFLWTLGSFITQVRPIFLGSIHDLSHRYLS
jgi:hypothetical protein